MNNDKLLQISNKLNVLKPLKGVRFNYAITKNSKIILDEAKNVIESIKQAEDFAAYEKERIDLCHKHSSKDKDGNSLDINGKVMVKGKEVGSFSILDEPAFEKELAELKDKNKKVIEEREKQVSEFNEFLKKESSVSLHKIKKEDIPEDINGDQMELIIDMIEDDK